MKCKYHVRYAPKLWMVLSSTEGAFLDLHNCPWSDPGFNSTLVFTAQQKLLTMRPRKKTVFPPHTNKQRAVFHVSIDYLHSVWKVLYCLKFTIIMYYFIYPSVPLQAELDDSSLITIISSLCFWSPICRVAWFHICWNNGIRKLKEK